MEENLSISKTFVDTIRDNYEDIIIDRNKANAFFTTKKVYTPYDYKVISDLEKTIIDDKLRKLRARNFLNTTVLRGINSSNDFNAIIDEWNYNINSFYYIKKEEIHKILNTIDYGQVDALVDGVLFTILNRKDCRITICDFLCLEFI